jgi:hypothetical protein
VGRIERYLTLHCLVHIITAVLWMVTTCLLCEFRHTSLVCYVEFFFHNFLLHLFVRKQVSNPVPCTAAFSFADHWLYLSAYFLSSIWLIILCVNDVIIHVSQSESSNKLTHTPPRTPPKSLQKWRKSHPLAEGVVSWLTAWDSRRCQLCLSKVAAFCCTLQHMNA